MPRHAEDDSEVSPTSLDENSPLLQHEPSEIRRRPPKLQLAILFLIQICEPITALVIYPFVNQLVRSTGVVGDDEKRTGYYAGIIESLFFWAEGATVLLWQIASQQYGRRPVLLLAPLGLGISMISFGLAKSFLGLVITRAFQGTFNGDVGVTKTALAELTDPSNRAEIMAMVPVFLNVGGTLAPFIGGIFSEPAHNWPNTLGKIELFQNRPYLLPCIISGILCLIGFGFALVGLEETHPSFKSSSVLKSPRSDRTTISLVPHARSVKDSLSTLFTRDVTLVLVASGFYAICVMSLRALQALIWSTSIENGGLGFNAFTIGTINTAFGIPNAVFQFLVLGKLMRHLGSKRAMLSFFILSFLALGLYPLQTHFAQQAGAVDWRVWSVIVIQLLCMSCKALGFASLLIFAVEVAQSPACIGLVQGTVQTTSVLMRGVAPALATSLFAYSIEHEVWGGYMVYVVLGMINLGAIGFAHLLPVVHAIVRKAELEDPHNSVLDGRRVSHAKHADDVGIFPSL
ncbi:major facilitator superfamily domain-containing protein [Flagelloscypha sp. PMI_526]|nr:major facilitator superfamily domain-containing protein [Flagelloscypha sp. PMI_526]